MGAAGHLVCSEPDCQGYSAGPFVTPRAAGELQESPALFVSFALSRSLFLSSLPLSNVDLDASPACLGGELQRPDSRRDPHAVFRIAEIEIFAGRTAAAGFQSVRNPTKREKK